MSEYWDKNYCVEIHRNFLSKYCTDICLKNSSLLIYDKQQPQAYFRENVSKTLEIAQKWWILAQKWKI